MDVDAIRERSRSRVETLKYRFNPNLPVLDEFDIAWQPREVTERILSLYACVACSHGFAKQNALDWLEQEKLSSSLSDSENEYLHGNAEERRTIIQWQVESLWSLTWSAGYHNELDFGDSCPDSFISIFPNLKTKDSTEAFSRKYALRSLDEIAEMVDLAYCLHWAVCDEGLTDTKSQAKRKVPGQVIEERRRGLEWLIGSEEWDDVSLDT